MAQPYEYTKSIVPEMVEAARSDVDDATRDMLTMMWEHMIDERNHTTNMIIDGLTSKRDRLEATLRLVRLQVASVLDRPGSSVPDILDALWPTQEAIADATEEIELRRMNKE